MTSSMLGVRNFTKDVLSISKFVSYFRNNTHACRCVEDTHKAERNKIIYNLTSERCIHKYGILGQSTVLRNSVWVTNCVLHTAFFILIATLF